MWRDEEKVHLRNGRPSKVYNCSRYNGFKIAQQRKTAIAMQDYILLAVFGLCLYGIYRLLQVGKRPANYPPGPPTMPIIGNIHQVIYPPTN